MIDVIRIIMKKQIFSICIIMKKQIFSIFGAVALIAAVSACRGSQSAADDSQQLECIAYVWADDGPVPPADMVTAINYLAAHPNETLDGVDINNVPRLRQLLDLKKQNPELRVILSMGGAGDASGWSEMICNDELRARFVADCKNIVDEYGLDGLDFDWEFPANKEEEAKYVLLFKEVREALGADKRVTAAAGFFGNGFDLKEAMKYLDYINLMSYDMGWQAPYHHTALRRSPLAGVCTIEESLDSCIAHGAQYKDIVLGLAFYGRGNGAEFKNWTDYRDIHPGQGMEERWDSIACVPYIVDSLGTLIVGYENPRSLEIKCDYIKEKGLKGGMYWRSELDNDSLDLTRTVARCLIGK